MNNPLFEVLQFIFCGDKKIPSIKDKLHFIEGFKYQVVEDIIIQTPFRFGVTIVDEYCTLYYDGRLLIRKGFAWDGPSGPTVDSLHAHIPAIVHDALYRMIRHGYIDISYKSQIDDLFYDMLVFYGMSRLRARVWYLGVHWFGKRSCTHPSRIITIVEKSFRI